MSLLRFVNEAIAEISRATERVDGVSLTTICMYPSNEFVSVVVRGGMDTFSVTDDGGAFRDVDSSVTSVRITDGMIRHILEPQGLRVVDGHIISPMVSRAALPIAIAMVANASKEVAEWFYSHLKIKHARNFKQMVRAFLEETFAQGVRHDEPIVGKSNKAHKFENVIGLPSGRRLIVDPVLNEHASISSRIVANIDVAQMKYEGLEQRIVYDDEEEWAPENLNLLSVGAPTVAFSQSQALIRRLGGLA